MFITAAKTAVVEALRAAFDDDNPDAPRLRRIDIEYVEDKLDWPCLLVEFTASSIEWTGVNADLYYVAEDPDDPGLPGRAARAGMFDGTVSLTILSTSAAERDAIYDQMVALLLMGRVKDGTPDFYETLANHDLIAMTVQEGTVKTTSMEISLGTPWDPDVLAYEASVSFDLTGQFFVDGTTRELAVLSSVRAYGQAKDGDYEGPLPVADGAEADVESDGLGQWV